MKQDLEQAIAIAVHELFDVSAPIELTRPEEKYGDYATNVALQLAGKLNRPPRELAEELAAKLRETLVAWVAVFDIAGPGFINLTLSDAASIQSLQAIPAQAWAGKTVLTEYSDPNPFKPLHAGHFYTTIVGDVIARLYEVGGARVTRINYGGDVGLHVGKSMWAIVQELGGEHPEKLAAIAVQDRPSWLGQRYVAGNNAYEDDEALRQQIIDTNKRVYALHEAGDHESAFAQIYWTCRTWSYDFFKDLYGQVQVHAFDRIIPESEIVPLGLQTVKEQLAKGVYEQSDGAVVFKGETYGLHTRVFINSQGLPTYEAKDVGLLMTKWQDYHFDRSVVITANEQLQYMEVMLKSVAQFAPEPAERSVHLTHGFVKLQGGVKMSSRKGNIVGALDILAAAGVANRAATGKDSPDTVLGAVKYAFLRQRIGGDIVYDPLESVSLEGNSGPYLQYAHARACSILRKAENRQPFTLEGASLDPGERLLVRKLSEYVEVVDKSVAEMMPHHICTYLYELAQSFNRFYEHNRVLGNEREQLRLQLVEQYAGVLGSGLELLGIVAPEQM